ncbi:MAG: site-specific DNA-methyltransferase [Christensenellaceae bacterium]|nr:site-specific DNA-methyltransferase [Christensenellaceae bacterium]
MEKLKMQSENLLDKNIEYIAKKFPNCISEGKIDFDLLRQELSPVLVEGKDERYRLDWVGKRQAILTANSPIAKTLRPLREESLNFDTTENLYLEGDNLDVLKLLHETYLSKIKMIYIDPPYNTGNDFIYNDDFADDADGYLTKSNQKDDHGNRMTANKETSGRYHSDWLSMMYMRLKLAKDLLTDDGAIFISIDDNEIVHLRKICDDIFGSPNFRNTILVRRRIKSLNSQFAASGLQRLNIGFEYVLIYAKSDNFTMRPLRMKKINASRKGRWDVFWSNADRPTMRYDVLGFTPKDGQWRYSKEKADVAVANYEKYQAEYAMKMTLEDYWEGTGCCMQFIRRISDGYGKNGGVQHWIAPSDTALRTSNWTDIEVSQIHKEIDIPFENPKSRELIQELVKLANLKTGDIVLDFFSGSATTAHAVMQLNVEENISIKYILVQLDEKINEKSEAYSAGYKTICEIGKDRIRRAGKKIAEENRMAVPDIDIGFRVLKLDDSNMRDVYYNPKAYNQDTLLDFITSIKEGRTAEDILFQVMLDKGVLPSSKIEKRRTTNGQQTYYIVGATESEVIDLICCLDKKIDTDAIKEIAKHQPGCCVFLDSGMDSDATRTNVKQVFDTYSSKTNLEVL